MNPATITELAISVITLVAAWLIGNKSVWGQRLSLAANLAWWFYVIAFGRWGLAPMQAFFMAITIRNLIKWERERRRMKKDNCKCKHRISKKFKPKGGRNGKRMPQAPQVSR